MKLFKNIKRLIRRPVVASIVVAALGLGVATQTNLLSNFTGRADANPQALACIHLVDGIHINDQNANADIRLVSPCGVRKFQMKMWYAPSSSGVPHSAQVLAFTDDTSADSSTTAVRLYWADGHSWRNQPYYRQSRLQLHHHGYCHRRDYRPLRLQLR
jgi:hypothetical protein